MNPREQFRKDWRTDAEVAALCVRLYGFLTTPSNHLEHFNFAQLKNAAATSDEKRLALALQYLSSPRWNMLHQVFFFFDAGNVYEFEAEEMRAYFEEGAFPHPVTGRVIRDLNQIAVAFEVGDFFEEAR
jgi:hypothetical protein